MYEFVLFNESLQPAGVNGYIGRSVSCFGTARIVFGIEKVLGKLDVLFFFFIKDKVFSIAYTWLNEYYFNHCFRNSVGRSIG